VNSIASGKPASGVETLRWKDGRIEMIDQRVLPARFDYLAFDSAEGVASAETWLSAVRLP